MTDEEFWEIIHSSRAAAGGSHSLMYRLTGRRLLELPAKEIIAWDEFFTDYLFRAFHWDLWGAAYIIEGGCSDDSFHDFRSWLISMGREVYQRSLNDADSLADLPDFGDDVFFEEFGYLGSRAYEKKTGHRIDDVPEELQPIVRQGHPQKPSGTRWKEEELPKRFPKLYEKCGPP